MNDFLSALEPNSYIAFEMPGEIKSEQNLRCENLRPRAWTSALMLKGNYILIS